MKKLNFKLLFMLLAFLAQACSSDDESFYYGPDYEIDDVQVTAPETESASSFAISLNLLSSNEYAYEYGFNPRVINGIADLNLSLISASAPTEIVGTDLNPYFLVDDALYFDAMYVTIADFVAKKELNSVKPILCFTNQTKLSLPYKALISDTTILEIQVDVTLSDSKKFSEIVTTTIIP
ncbi:MAG: hypothetical protein ACK5IJ_02655 [Mangrovibacterium sp.]